MMMPIGVVCRRAEAGWTCDVTIGEDAAATHHVVTVMATALERLAPDASEPTRLVRASFEFLLEREPRESILRSFELPLIGRYFPEYPDEIVRKLGQ
jgi:hypothetical protein